MLNTLFSEFCWYFRALYRKIRDLFSQKNMSMIIAEHQDEYGIIRIYESGDYRFLEFGLQIEQSCVFMPDPSWLEYDYTRAMLMGGFMHSHPQSALFLGLGAGTLTTACLKHLPLSTATAIELRTGVVELAHQHLAFSNDQRLTIRIGDALKLLPEQPMADLIFLDLYTDEGPSEGHSAWDFLGACHEKLNPNGWLIINQWALPNGLAKDAPLLRARFKKHYWECLVHSGNIVLFIPQNQQQMLDIPLLQQKITDLTPTLGYNLQPLANNLILTSQD